MRKTRWFRTTQ